MISAFVKDLSRHIEGTPNKEGLLQSIRPAEVEFKKAIRATAPNFKANRSGNDEWSQYLDAPPEFLASEEDPAVVVHSASRAIFVEDVMERALQ